MRAAQWVRNPPSEARIKLVFGAIALALLIFGIEWLGLWPEWATTERARTRF
jgi:hypothetical protein